MRDNQSVKKGDIILRLDDRDYRANVARLEGFRSSLRWPPS
nr:biotin/lipoyl-binding protein [Escherichia coli]